MVEKIRTAKPWDLLNNNIPKVTKDIEAERYSICKGCPEFLSATTQCKKCGCIMKLKTKLSNASCPIGKWDAVTLEDEVR